ncbi:MAG: HNH endonuclease [Bacteroidales bacterium]|nr:HNH endonuclease [Bacteroidales bacterium]
METKNLLDVFDREMQCEYKGRRYLARDNGAICRLPKDGGRPSKLDNVWSFGTKNPENGYMMFTGNIRVHQVVCTAFHGPEPEPHMVVDHIDTNRCNNRPENLRWLTRLENALNNPATRRKIIYHCGSVEAFMADPSILRTKALPPNIDWMRTVTKEEAANCKKHIQRWAEEDKPKGEPTGQGVGEWIFSEEVMAGADRWNGGTTFPEYKTRAQHEAEIAELWRQYRKENYGLKNSLTSGAKQLNWKTPTEFLLCPAEGQERTLQTYLGKLVKGKIFTRTQYGIGGEVLDCGINEADNALYVLTHDKNVGAIKPWALCKITLEDGFYVHESQGSFFQEDGGQKNFTLAMGREWTGGEVFDDFC